MADRSILCVLVTLWLPEQLLRNVTGLKESV
jgi:hypothetical protein